MPRRLNNSQAVIANLYSVTLLECCWLVENICNEVVTVGRAAGIQLPQCDMINKTKTVIRMTSENKSSMLQDIERNRPTEIDSINGAIVNVGKKYGVDSPVNETLTIMIKGMEQMNQTDEQ